MSEIFQQMRADWNQRAREDAHYYVAFGGRNQDEEGFLATGAAVVSALEQELKRLPASDNPRARRALEIGCGPGRLMRPLSRHFGEIHGVDVSDEMIALARQRLQDIPHAHVHATNGASLNLFAGDSFDLVYSYAVFQHVPSREVVIEYMHETVRVLKPGGIFRGQFNGLAPGSRPDTWSGVSFSPQEIRDFTLANDLELLALDGLHTQYMWTTWRKRDRRAPAHTPAPVSIHRISNAFSSEPVVPDRGVLSALSVWMMNLPPDSDLNSLDVRIDGPSGLIVFVGPPQSDGLQQVNVMLPAATRTGLVPVELRRDGELLCPAALVRVIPAGPLVPRIVSLRDGLNLSAENCCTSGIVKVQLEEVLHPESVTADVDLLPVRQFEILCTDPLPSRYEINFLLPEGIGPGRHDVRIHVGRRVLMPHELTVG